jgi:inorganic pyrophosphatase
LPEQFAVGGVAPNVMARHARHVILSKTASFDSDTGDLRVVVETPKGSRNKYDYDPGCDCFDLATVLPEGMSFPYDFGFIPSTVGEDGDPLDILLLQEAPGFPGCVVRARLLGAIEAEQKKKGEKWIRNDRLIALAAHAQTHERIKSLADLRPHLVKEIESFFIEYNELRGREFKPLDACGPKKAMRLVKQAMKNFKKGRKR